MKKRLILLLIVALLLAPIARAEEDEALLSKTLEMSSLIRAAAESRDFQRLRSSSDISAQCAEIVATGLGSPTHVYICSTGGAIAQLTELISTSMTDVSVMLARQAAEDIFADAPSLISAGETDEQAVARYALTMNQSLAYIEGVTQSTFVLVLYDGPVSLAMSIVISQQGNSMRLQAAPIWLHENQLRILESDGLVTLLRWSGLPVEGVAREHSDLQPSPSPTVMPLPSDVPLDQPLDDAQEEEETEFADSPFQFDAMPLDGPSTTDAPEETPAPTEAAGEGGN